MPVVLVRRRRTGARGGSLRGVREAVLEVLERERAREREVSVLLTDDREIRGLNAEFRGQDKPTDVLAFALDEVEGGPRTRLLGDVVISVERAVVQAANRRVSIDRELELLAVHGTLHLLGFDHDIPSRARLMRARTRAIRAALERARRSARECPVRSG